MVYLTQLLGLPILNPDGTTAGKLRDVIVEPSQHRHTVQKLVLRRDGKLWETPARLTALDDKGMRLQAPASPQLLTPESGHLLLTRDVLDQQIIDVNGRKVVRVNDVELETVVSNGHQDLNATRVDVGVSGALRRLLQGIVPRRWLPRFSNWAGTSAIPWNMFDLVETDAARRVKLQITYEALAHLHPADVADIVEDLAPAEREAVFASLENEVAAEVLGEVEPRLQRELLENLDSERAADIVEEMDPDEAADMLAELPQETSSGILEDMEAPEREEVSDLLEFREDSAGGRMTTDFLAFGPGATVADGVAALRAFDGPVETVTTLFAVDADLRLVASIPLARILLATGDTLLTDLGGDTVSIHQHRKDSDVAELFDKYNLLALPVLDVDDRLIGIITADDVISQLRDKKG